MKHSEYSDDLFDDEKLNTVQKELESMLVSTVVRRTALNNQLNVFNNFPYELTADNHCIITVSIFVKKKFKFHNTY